MNIVAVLWRRTGIRVHFLSRPLKAAEITTPTAILVRFSLAPVAP